LNFDLCILHFEYSIAHYLFARYSPVHPALYLNHQAKPLFVLNGAIYLSAGSWLVQLPMENLQEKNDIPTGKVSSGIAGLP